MYWVLNKSSIKKQTIELNVEHKSFCAELWIYHPEALSRSVRCQWRITEGDGIWLPGSCHPHIIAPCRDPAWALQKQLGVWYHHNIVSYVAKWSQRQCQLISSHKSNPVSKQCKLIQGKKTEQCCRAAAMFTMRDLQSFNIGEGSWFRYAPQPVVNKSLSSVELVQVWPLCESGTVLTITHHLFCITSDSDFLP